MEGPGARVAEDGTLMATWGQCGPAHGKRHLPYTIIHLCLMPTNHVTVLKMHESHLPQFSFTLCLLPQFKI